MAIEWYCEIEGKKLGPMSPFDLKNLADAGKLQATSMIWKEGMQKKVPARTVRGLFDGPGGGTATATKPPPAERPPPAAKTQIADPMPALKTQMADPGVEHQTWIEKPATPKAPPKKNDDVVETQVAEDVVDTQVAEDIVDTQTADKPVAAEEPIVPVAAAPPKRKSSGLRADRERSRREEADAGVRQRDVVPPPAPPVADKPFRVFAGGEVRGPFSLDELRGQLGAGKLGEADLVGVETWLPLSTLSGLLFDDAVARGLAAQRKLAQAAAIVRAAADTRSDFVPAVADDHEDLVPAAADEEVVVAAHAPLKSAAKKPAEDDLVPALADMDDDDVHDIPVSEVEEVNEPKPQPAKKPEIPASGAESIPVDEEFQL